MAIEKNRLSARAPLADNIEPAIGYGYAPRFKACFLKLLLQKFAKPAFVPEN